MRRWQLDDAGGAPELAEVTASLGDLPWGNPSSLHAEGRAARAALDSARDRAAAAIDAEPADLVFCASGTEAVNLALVGAGRRLARGRRVVTWAAEHVSVLAAVRRLELEGHPVAILPVDSAAAADPGLIPDDAGLVSIGMANGEVGTVQPVDAVVQRCRELGALVHIDTGQAPRWLRPPTGADLMSFSGRKLGAGPGGLLMARLEVPIEPLIVGGPHERGRRAGSEDVRSAVAISVALGACRERRDERSVAVAPLARSLRGALIEAGGIPTGAENRLPNLASACFDGVRGEDLLLALDRVGIAASSGSACASGSLDPSHVLIAMGRSLREAEGSLRLSLGYEADSESVAAAAALLGSTLLSLVRHAEKS